MESERGQKKYKIEIGSYGSLSVEAPTKEECIELFKEVTKVKKNLVIDEDIV